MSEITAVRVDKWLWAVRIYKTRSLAATACRIGHVTVAGQPVKASHGVKINEVLIVKKDNLTRTFKVLGLLDKRVGAPLAKDYVQDQTPESELQKARDIRFQPVGWRPKGSGRPTKKERRDLDQNINDLNV
jgi:ribosome-associated heat shock protein Hsp15